MNNAVALLAERSDSIVTTQCLVPVLTGVNLCVICNSIYLCSEVGSAANVTIAKGFSAVQMLPGCVTNMQSLVSQAWQLHFGGHALLPVPSSGFYKLIKTGAQPEMTHR